MFSGRKILRLILILCFSILLHFSYRLFKYYDIYRIRNVNYDQGYKNFADSLKKKFPKISNKEYYYVNIWNTFCKPCIDEMPILDSIAPFFQNKNIAFILITDDKNSVVENFFQKKHLKYNNLHFLNSMNSFISAICIEKGNKNKLLPMHIVINHEGKILYYGIGSFPRVNLNHNGLKQAQKQLLKNLSKPEVLKFIENLPTKENK
ncbi:MAG: TlpA family protein disulfide reductase [Bacteroidia bacterium]